MPTSVRYGLIRRAETTLPRGRPFDNADLRALGISPSLAAWHVRAGWLQRLGRGVYAHANDQLTRDGALVFLQRRVEGLHVGGKTALDWQGVRHNLAVRETLVLWGQGRGPMPEWFTSRFQTRYQTSHLFSLSKQRQALGIGTPVGFAAGLAVSSPERAALELLSDVGRRQGLEEAKNIFEGLRGLRLSVLGPLLQSCTSVKVVRLFLQWATEFEVVDVAALKKDYTMPTGSSKRWMKRLKDGTLLTLK